MKSKTKTRSFKFIVFFLFFVLLISSAILPRAGASFALADSEITTDDFAYDESAETLEEFKDITSLSFIRFYEYGFGDGSQFELHFYLYNTERTDYIDDSRNKAQIGFSNNDKDVFRVTYNKYTLAFAGKSETGLFLKYKITGFNMPTSETRYYCFSGVELVKEGATNATEYGVSRIFKCVTKDNVTTISTDDLPTCEVDVTHTFWRSPYGSYNTYGVYGTNTTTQISSCYFALPESYSGSSIYGRLEALTAEFWNYYTKPILITDKRSVYNTYYDARGKEGIPELTSGKELTMQTIAERVAVDELLELLTAMGANSVVTSGVHAISELVPADFYHKFDILIGSTDNIAQYKVQTKESAETWWWPFDGEEIVYPGGLYFPTLEWIFYDPTANFDSKHYNFTGTKLAEYYYELQGSSSMMTNGHLFLDENTYNHVVKSVKGFPYGYNKHTYSIASVPEQGDDVLGYEIRGETIDNGWLKPDTTENISLLPLVQVDPADCALSTAEFSSKYYITESEVDNLKAYTKENSDKARDTWILRYDATSYYARKADGDKGLLAMEPVYLDFDILSFRFDQNGNKYTVAALSSPENVFNDITKDPSDPGNKDESPTKEPTFWERFVEFLKKIGAWAIVIIGGAVGVSVIFFMLKLLKKTWQSDTALIWKIIVTLICIGLCVIVGIYVVPWVINVVDKLGGLRLKE